MPSDVFDQARNLSNRITELQDALYDARMRLETVKEQIALQESCYTYSVDGCKDLTLTYDGLIPEIRTVFDLNRDVTEISLIGDFTMTWKRSSEKVSGSDSL